MNKNRNIKKILYTHFQLQALRKKIIQREGGIQIKEKEKEKK